MKMKLSDHFKYKNFSEELLPFLNNFLSTSVLMAISLSVVIMHVNKIVTFFMIFFMIIVILAMFINNKKFVSCIIDNPVPESVPPFYNAKGPKPLGWYMEFLKTLLKEKIYVCGSGNIFFDRNHNDGKFLFGNNKSQVLDLTFFPQL